MACAFGGDGRVIAVLRSAGNTGQSTVEGSNIAMKTIAKLGVVLCIAAGVSYADSWTGKLLDAPCHDRSLQPGQAKSSADSCAATATTSAFAIQTADGKVFKLDASGNAKAATILRGNPDSKEPSVTVSGSMDGQTVKVDSIDLKK